VNYKKNTSREITTHKSKVMSTPNPLMPQGAIAQPKGKSNVKIAVFTILAIHAVLLVGLLVQGCNKKPAAVVDNSPSTNDTSLTASSATTDPNLGASAGTGSASFVPPANAPGATTSTPVTTPNTTTAVTPQPVLTPVTPAVTTPVPPTVDPGATANVSAPSGKEYVVARGDSLGKIAKKNGVSVKALQEANPNIVPTKLQIGQKLQIPAAAASTASAVAPATGAVADAAPVSNDGVYVVKSGDVLERIAKSHGTSVKAIKTANNLHTDHLKVGQKLKMPAGKATAMADAAPAAPASPLATSTITPTATMAAATTK
jgi:LysM repeat protein